MKCSIKKVPRAPCSVLMVCALCTVHCAQVLACTLCKEALPTGMAKGFYWSILWMLTVPAVVVGVIAGALWRAGQKRRGVPGDPHE